MKNLLNEYLKYLVRERKKSRSTLTNYRLYLRRFIEAVKITHPSEINQETCDRFRQYLYEYKDEHQQPLKSKTINYHLIALRNFLKFLKKKGTFTLAANKVKLSPTSKSEVLTLTKEELKRLLEGPDSKNKQGLRDKAMLELLASTGLKVSELCALNRKQINLEEGVVYVKGLSVKSREVFLSPRAVKATADYLKIREDTFDPLFIRFTKFRKKADPGGSDLRLTPRTVQRVVKKCGIKMGIAIDVTPQTLRHSFAKAVLANGASLKSVQKLLGHQSITTTQVYT